MGTLSRSTTTLVISITTLSETFTACGVHERDALVEPKLLRPRESSNPPAAARTTVCVYHVILLQSCRIAHYKRNVQASSVLRVPSPNSTGEESSGQLPEERERERGILTFRLKISLYLHIIWERSIKGDLTFRITIKFLQGVPKKRY